MRSARNACVIPLGWIVSALAGSIVLVAVMMRDEALTLSIEPRLDAIAMLSGLVATAILLGWRAPRTRLQRVARDFTEYLATFACLCVVMALASYPVAAVSRGFVDPALEQVDHVLRFDWLAWYDFVADHALVQLVERGAYEAIFLSPAILLASFALADRRAEARRFIASYWIAALLTLVLFVWLPARGPLAMEAHGALPYMPESALYQANIIPGLRDHQLHGIALGSLHGLVGAPSFHTASAVLFIAAAWRSRTLRWPMLALNVAMLLATPVEGTHYLADMLIGAAVALTALALTRALIAALEREPATTGAWARALSRPAPSQASSRRPS